MIVLAGKVSGSKIRVLIWGGPGIVIFLKSVIAHDEDDSILFIVGFDETHQVHDHFVGIFNLFRVSFCNGGITEVIKLGFVPSRRIENIGLMGDHKMGIYELGFSEVGHFAGTFRQFNGPVNPCNFFVKSVKKRLLVFSSGLG